MKKPLIPPNRQIIKKFPFLRAKFLERRLPKYKRGVFKEPFYHFESNFFKSRHTVFLKGGWQSYKYFSKYSTEVIAALQLKNAIISEVAKKDILNNHEGVVSVHVRRGDYLRKPVILEWHGVMDKAYYAEAFEQVAKKTAIKKVFYFFR